MFEFFFETITKTIELSESDKRVLRNNYLVKKLKKRQFFLQEGDVCKYAGFITKGCLKTYSIDKNGDEHVFQIAIEGW
jgi:CRP-like cAMP-binding protein